MTGIESGSCNDHKPSGFALIIFFQLNAADLEMGFSETFNSPDFKVLLFHRVFFPPTLVTDVFPHLLTISANSDIFTIHSPL